MSLIPIRPLQPSDRDELVRMRIALWPDSTADEVDDLLTRLSDTYVIHATPL